MNRVIGVPMTAKLNLKTNTITVLHDTDRIMVGDTIVGYKGLNEDEILIELKPDDGTEDTEEVKYIRISKGTGTPI